jgi:diguanylate cyclase (GGDEF)-like protein/PAS domain S-box-containing protein
MVYTPFIWPLLVSAALLGGIAINVRHYSDVPAIRPFIFLAWLAAAWAFFYALNIATAAPDLKALWAQLQMIPAIFVASAIFAMVLEYVGQGQLLTRRNLALLMVEPTLAVIFELSSRYHQLFRYNFRVESSGPLPFMLTDTGPLFWAHYLYSLGLILLSCGILLTAFRIHTLHPRNTFIILLGILIPLVSGLLYTFGVTPIRGFDLTPVLFIVTGLLYLWALLRFQLFNVAPVSRNTIMDNMEGLVVVLDMRGHIADFNRAAQTALALSPAIIGAAPNTLPQPWADLFERHANTFDFKHEITLSFDNAPHSYDLTISKILDKQDRTLGRLFLFYNITERKRAEQALRQSEKRYHQLIELLPDGLVTHRNGDILFVNPATVTLIGASSPDQLVGKNVMDFVHPASRDIVIQRMQKLFKEKTILSLADEKFIRLDGRTIDVEVLSRPLELDGSTVFLSVFRDVTERKQAEEKLQELSRAVEQSPASIVITDTSGMIEYVNPRFSQVTGYSFEEAIGQNPRILRTDKTPLETHRQLWETITAGREWQGEFVNQKKNGEFYFESALISPIIDAQGVVTHYLAVKEDITERKRSENELREATQKLRSQLEEIQLLQTELREQAIRDPLTGLYNRRYLNETLEREIARAEREHYPISFVMIDIDRFKNINDTLGHATGDVVLQKLAAQLLSQTRVVDIACRYGGEEFLVILPNVTAEIAFQIAERWRMSFMGLTMPLEYNAAQSTISSGISEYPLNGKSGEELISIADKAMYQAKKTGRNKVVIWHNDLSK